MSDAISKKPDDDLESALDEVGRDKAFARARAAGWSTYSPPPKWVWWQIVDQMRKAQHND